jgi:predicted RNase H-like nuclease (RuvC/YqgF family)
MRQSLVKLHPRTGLPLKPVGYVRGRAVWPILGASEDDEGGDSDDQPDDDTSGGGDGDDDHQDDGDKDERNPRIKELSDENAKRRNEAKQLRKELEEAQKRLKEIDDADKSEVERLKEQTTELTSQLEEAQESLRESRLHNAFLASNKYTWHEPDTALKLVDLSEVSIEEDGSVKGMDAALKALADSKPYLVRKEQEEEEPKTPTGTPAGSGGRKDKSKLDRERLEKKYPAIRR